MSSGASSKRAAGQQANAVVIYLAAVVGDALKPHVCWESSMSMVNGSEQACEVVARNL